MFLVQIGGTGQFLGSKQGKLVGIIVNLLIFIFSPLVQLAALLGFIVSWKRRDSHHEVRNVRLYHSYNGFPFEGRISLRIQSSEDYQRVAWVNIHRPYLHPLRHESPSSPMVWSDNISQVFTFQMSAI